MQNSGGIFTDNRKHRIKVVGRQEVKGNLYFNYLKPISNRAYRKAKHYRQRILQDIVCSYVLLTRFTINVNHSSSQS